MEKLENKTKLIDLINFDRVNVLLENFNKATGFVTAILDDEGNVLSKSGWRQICTEFHRKNAESANRCNQSDLLLSGKLAEGQNFHCHNCLNGLVDAAVPIIINDEFVGNLFTGQFFLKKPDRKFFQEQALKYGFEEKVYLDALDKVPVVSENQVNHVMNFLLNMTELISEMTLQSFEQKRLNHSLKESEEKFRNIFDHSPLGKSITNIDGNLEINRAFSELLGYTVKELESKNWREITHPEDIKESVEIVQSLLDGKVSKAQYEKRYLHKNGSIVWTEVITALIKDDENKPKYFQTTINDIGERKLAEIKLNRLTEILKETGRIGKIGGWEFDVKTGEGTWTEEVAQIHDLDSNKKTNSEKGLSFYNADSRERIEKAIGEAIKYAKPYDLELELISAKGVHKWVRTLGNPKIINNEVVKLYGTFQDITTRKQAEIEIRNKENQFRTIVESAGDAMFLADYKTQKIILANEQACKVLGYSIEELLGLRLNEIDPTYLNEEEVEKIWSSFEIDIPLTIETQHKRKDGSIIPVEVKTVLINYNGKKTVLGFSRDITERKVAVEKIQQSEKQYRMLFNLLPYGGEVLDIHGNIINCSSSTAKMLGYSVSELIGQPIAKFLAPESLVSFKNKFPLLLSGKPANAEIQLIRKDGVRLDILRAAQPLLDDNGKVESILALNLNITDRVLAEKELAKYREHLEELVKTRTLEVDEKNQKLSEQMKIFVGREMTIIGLQNRVRALEGK